MLYQSQSHALRPLTTAHMAQTMSLLELTNSELRQKIESALASNPALEMMDEYRCPHCHRPLPEPGSCPICCRPLSRNQDQPIVFVSPRSDFAPTRYDSSENEHLSFEDFTPAVEDLATYVLRQIAPELPAEDRGLAAHILTSLDEDGLLRIPIEEIARYHHVLLSRIQKVVKLIQHADPVGVGSPNPQAALLIQLEVLAETRPVPPLARLAIQNGLDLLSRRAFLDLGHLLGVSITQAQEIARFIGENLNPFPARAHWGDSSGSVGDNPVYHNPDVIISTLTDTPDSPLVVEVISPYAGSLRVNPLFREIIQDMPADKAEKWQADLEQAALLVKCIQQRNHTLVRLMQRLVVMQRDFLLRGDAYLLPVTRASLAIELDVHESTISRAVSDKAVQLPSRQIIPLSRLFDRSLHVRTALRVIIAAEGRPLSDSEIADLLISQGYPVARRTVAKYRSMEGILPARYRSARLAANPA
jgi:RNA polymerase sigma-54 factor